MQKLSQKKIDASIQAAYLTTSSGVQVPIMQLSRIWNVGRASVLGGDTDEMLQQKMRAFVDTVSVAA